jgi:ferredoxin-NADP reductase
MMVQTNRPLQWQEVSVVRANAESESSRTIAFNVPEWRPHLPGQHFDIRLTAPDGYQASRSYSISSASHEPPQITVERVEDGEVSPFLVDVVEVGDTFEVRGPIGGYFVWDPRPEPLLLVGGGSGIAPLRSMWRSALDSTPVTVMYSARDRSRLMYRSELNERDNVSIHLTRAASPGFIEGRIDRDSLRRAVEGAPESRSYVCGPTSFVESVVKELATIVDDPGAIRAERFG